MTSRIHLSIIGILRNYNFIVIVCYTATAKGPTATIEEQPGVAQEASATRGSREPSRARSRSRATTNRVTLQQPTQAIQPGQGEPSADVQPPVAIQGQAEAFQTPGLIIGE